VCEYVRRLISLEGGKMCGQNTPLVKVAQAVVFWKEGYSDQSPKFVGSWCEVV